MIPSYWDITITCVKYNGVTYCGLDKEHLTKEVNHLVGMGSEFLTKCRSIANEGSESLQSQPQVGWSQGT